MEGSTFSMAEYRHDLDRGMKNAMPDSWEGHSRLALAEIADDLSEREYQFAQRIAARIHRPSRTEMVARVAKQKTLEKLRE